MNNKVWHKVIISTDFHSVEVYPTEEFDGIIVEAKEVDGSISQRTYLNEKEMELLILKMRQMMNYVKGGEQ